MQPAGAARYDHLFKVIVVGNAGVGKTSLIRRFVSDSFSAREASTIGTEFQARVLHLRGLAVKVSIWDTAGQERFRSLTTSWYRGAHAVVLVYDISDRASFDALASWAAEADLYASFADAARLVVGAKLDLDREARAVPREAGEQFARAHRMLFIETSAKECTGVAQAFEELVLKVLDTPALVGGGGGGGGGAGEATVSLQEAQDGTQGGCAC
jgi:Ras-related protein Rab-18